MASKIHSTAEVSEKASIGDGSSIWHYVQIREGAVLGQNCIVGKNAYIDFDVKIGNNCKIQNNASLYHGLTLSDGVFVGPHVVFANDKNPRAITSDGVLKSASDWVVSPTFVGKGASIGARTVVLPGVTIGDWAMVGAGSVVTKDVPGHGLVYGNPARLRGIVCDCGLKVVTKSNSPDASIFVCQACKTEFNLPSNIFESINQQKKATP